jgi:hypothetical protein
VRSIADFLNNSTKELIEGWERWLGSGRVANGSKYNGCQLFVSPYSLRFWLGAAPKAPITSGAPGRPSGMGIVMGEFERRRANGGSVFASS